MELDPDNLEEEPLLLSQRPMTLVADGPALVQLAENTVEVASFEELQIAIDKAGTSKTTIIVTESFELSKTITINSGQNIILTTNNYKKADEAWDPIKQPADYADQGETMQRQII